MVKLALPDGDNTDLVVLKAPHEELTNEKRFTRMLATESRIMARMRHPNICKVAGLKRFKGDLVMEMEYLRGQTLRRVLQKNEKTAEFTQNMHLRVLYQVLEALDYAHRVEGDDGWCLNLVHRDVSPHNIFLTYDGEIKLLDFGIAKLSAGSFSTTAGTLKGKLAYMAPEQLDPSKAEPRSDLFSIGVMLWEALTGKRMWQDLEQKAVVHHLTTRSIPALPQSNVAVPEELARLCRRAVSPDPEQRPATARVFSDALRSYLIRTKRVVGNPDVGNVVARMFADERRQMEQLIGGELQKLKRSLTSERAGRSRPTMPADGTAPRVMVIDDSELSRSLMTELLEEAGIAALALPTALDAIRIALQENVRVIISDVNMPALPGTELVKRIRQNPGTQDVRIFLTSALSLHELGHVDADGLIEKDRLEEELVPLVRQALRTGLTN